MMDIDLAKFTASNYAAWWGAIIATLTLVWNIVVAIRSGARIKVRANPNMKVYPTQPITGDKSYISVTAVNHGTSPTTITHFCGFYAHSFWDLMRGKKQQFVVPTHPALGKTVPYVLAPGDQWSSLADQDYMLEKAKGGFLYLGIIHNQRKRPLYKRVKVSA